MDRKKFFDSVRNSPDVFGKMLTGENVIGTEAIIDACLDYNVLNTHHMSNILANVYHETGGYMMPIKETVMPSHKNKNPSDAEVIRRLDLAFQKGQLTWVKTPYWRKGAFGRGQLQITHHDNYVKLGNAIGVDLATNYSRALELQNSAAIAVVGMSRGLFTGKKLSDYGFPSALDSRWQDHPRRIVNGKDGTDASIKKYHLAFFKAFSDAGYTGGKVEIPEQTPQRTRGVILAEIQALLDELKAIGD